MEQSNTTAAGGNQQSRIRYGVYQKPGDFTGKTVGEVRGEFSKMWGIPKDAAAHVGTAKVDDNHVIQPGENVEFHRRAGEKG